MIVRFVGQPFAGQRQVGEVLSQALTTATRLRVVVAWAQLSGLHHIRAAILALRKRGGSAVAIVGIDQGFATIDGLRAAMELFAPAYVFHDTGRRTFHPKLYIVEGNRRATVIIGSANLTEGGLYRGYESAVLVQLDRAKKADRALFLEISQYFVSLVGGGQACRPLDRGLLNQLAANRKLTKTKTQQRNERRQARKFEKAAAALFGGAVRGLAGAPERIRQTQRSKGRHRRRVSLSRPLPPGTGRIVASWFKRLTASDAMRKPARSHQRRYVILSQAGHAIDPRSYFRDEFFGNVAWTRIQMHTGNSKEVATVPFEVFIERRYLGQFEISVDHAPNRVADQGNSPTWLNWSSLAHEINRRSFTGDFLVLEKLPDGRFRLSLTATEPTQERRSHHRS